MNKIGAFFTFWYDFVVGDDWLAAAGVALGLAATWGLVHADLNPWWLLPPWVAVSFALSLRRAVRTSR
jgi:hypothetical protein